MESQQPDENVVQKESIIAPLQKVTPTSKYLALALFILLPFLGGWVGYTYAPEKVVEISIPNQVPAESGKTVTDISDAQISDIEIPDSLKIVSCSEGTENIEGLSLDQIEQAYNAYHGEEWDFMNDDFLELHLENNTNEKVGFHCRLNDDSVVLSVFGSSVGDLSIIRIANNQVTNEVESKIEQFGSDTVIEPKFDDTAVTFVGHIIDPCYDLAQNFKFDLTNFSLDLVNVTGGDIPNCEANI